MALRLTGRRTAGTVPAMTQLDQATILITGAAGGFGRHLTSQLLAAGGRLVLADLEAPDGQMPPREEATKSAGSIVACLAADLSTTEGCYDLIRQVDALGVDIDILVNNAGIAHFGAFDDVPQDAWQRLLQVNLNAPMVLSQHFCRGMVARRHGHVLNISSVAGWVASHGLAAYSASKFGLRGFSDSLRHELRPHGVQVTAVYPFFSRTPILDAPRYGDLHKPHLPDTLTTDPADVVRAMVRGLETNRDHVFPDRNSRRLHWLVRLVPGWLPWLQERLQRRLDARFPPTAP